MPLPRTVKDLHCQPALNGGFDIKRLSPELPTDAKPSRSRHRPPPEKANPVAVEAAHGAQRKADVLDGTPQNYPRPAARASNVLNRADPATIAAQHHEILVRYAWERRRRRGFVVRATLIMMVRLRELERLFATRYGRTLPDDGAGRDDLFIAAGIIAGANPEGDVAGCIVAWLAMWCP